MTTIKFNDLSANARNQVQQMSAAGGQVYARKKGRGYTIEQFTEPPFDGWLLVTDVTAAEPESSQAEAAASGGFELVPLDLIDPNPYQPRLSQDTEALESLARGLRLKREQLPDTCGLMQVPIARPVAGRYELAFGHRRRAAFRLLYEQHGDEWQLMPLRVVALDDEQMYDYAARENGDREDINPIEKALSIKRAQDELGWDLTRAANAHGLSKSAGSNLTRLLQLPELVQSWVSTGELGQRHARELLRLIRHEPPLMDEAEAAGRSAIDGEWNVGEVEDFVDEIISDYEHRNRRVLRYCRTCGTKREFTGLELDRGKAVDCSGCGYNGPPAMWRDLPLPSLPTEPVAISGVKARMYGHWYCGFCSSHEEPGQAIWVTIGNQDLKVCFRCEQRLRPLATEPEPDTSPKLLNCPHCNGDVRDATGGGLVCDCCGEEWLNLRRFREDVRDVQSRGQSDTDRTGHCPGCGHHYELHEATVRNDFNLKCPECGAINQASRWLAAVGRAEAELSDGKLNLTLHPLPGSPPEAGPERYSIDFGQKPETRGEFDCPRCNEEQIVKVNGSAVCFGCDTRWETPADFHTEAQGQQPETARQRRATLRERWGQILSRLDEMQLDEAEHWLIDFEERIKSKWA